MEYQTTFYDGISIVHVPYPEDKPKVKGIWKVKNRYKAQINLSGQRFYLGTFTSLADAENARITAENHVSDGTFLQWYKSKKQ